MSMNRVQGNRNEKNTRVPKPPAWYFLLLQTESRLLYVCACVCKYKSYSMYNEYFSKIYNAVDECYSWSLKVKSTMTTGLLLLLLEGIVGVVVVVVVVVVVGKDCSVGPPPDDDKAGADDDDGCSCSSSYASPSDSSSLTVNSCCNSPLGLIRTLWMLSEELAKRSAKKPSTIKSSYGIGQLQTGHFQVGVCSFILMYATPSKHCAWRQFLERHGKVIREHESYIYKRGMSDNAWIKNR